jgi:hypothetical protein
MDDKNSSALSGKFQQLKAQHIYREYNKEADQLSKQALQLDEEGIYYAVGTKIQTERFERLPIN